MKEIVTLVLPIISGIFSIEQGIEHIGVIGVTINYFTYL